MNKNQIALSSLAMDLKRAALGYHRDSIGTARRFFQEAIKRREEIDQLSIKPYLRKLLLSIEKAANQEDKKKAAEDLLMYSTILQNAALRS